MSAADALWLLPLPRTAAVFMLFIPLLFLPQTSHNQAMMSFTASFSGAEHKPIIKPQG